MVFMGYLGITWVVLHSYLPIDEYAKGGLTYFSINQSINKSINQSINHLL